MKKVRLFRKKNIALVAFAKDLYAYHRLKRDRGFWAALSPVFENSESKGCDYDELWMLYRYVLCARPGCILELGSGVSTVVIAYALKLLSADEHTCTFVSLEEAGVYYEQLKSIFPEDLASHVELILSPTEDRHLDGGFIARRYVNKPRHAYDFVFIDGPQVPKEPGHFDGDILDVIDWNPEPFVAFLDERINTRKIFKKLLPFARLSETREFAKFYFPAAAQRRIGYTYIERP